MRRIMNLKNAKNILIRLAIYLILFGLGFVFLYPILYMLSVSFMTRNDLINVTIEWIPTSFYLGNIQTALSVLNVGEAMKNSILVAGGAAICQTVSCALAGYAFARFKFPLKNFFMVMLIVIFIIPTGVTMIPKYVMFHSYGWSGSIASIIIPALFGQGLNSSLIILVFFQYFKTSPKSLEEAAMLDGASKLKVFLKVMLPLAGPAILVSLIFSFVWYWNETYQYFLLVGNDVPTMTLSLEYFISEYEAMYKSETGSVENILNEGLTMSATLITVSPLIIFYLIMQKYFVEAIETTGITGE